MQYHQFFDYQVKQVIYIEWLEEKLLRSFKSIYLTCNQSYCMFGKTQFCSPKLHLESAEKISVKSLHCILNIQNGKQYTLNEQLILILDVNPLKYFIQLDIIVTC